LAGQGKRFGISLTAPIWTRIAVAHFSIPMSDIAKSTQFYTDVVGCRHLSTTPNGQMVFLDAAGTCLILVKRNPPINPVPDNHSGVHHAFAVAHASGPG
jgi:catechol-2,3-dioxygenase